jgi:hypothetical protein
LLSGATQACVNKRGEQIASLGARKKHSCRSALVLDTPVFHDCCKLNYSNKHLTRDVYTSPKLISHIVAGNDVGVDLPHRFSPLVPQSKSRRCYCLLTFREEIES